MFLGREEEKKAISEFISEDRKTVLAVYGRRRVGKTSLVIGCLQEAKDVVINYTCEKDDYFQNVFKFLDRAKTALGNIPLPSFDNFRDIFGYFRTFFSNRKLIVFLDEFPYLFNENMDDPRLSEFQAIIDESQNSNLKIILCGSSLHFMNSAFSSYANPLYGRADKFVELRPFTFLETKKFFPKRNFRDIFLAYGISGGIPIYLSILLSYSNIEKAMENECFSYNGYFFKEAIHFLKGEFDETVVIERILSCLGGEERNTSEIAKRANIKVNGINYHLNKLEGAYFVKKVENAFEGKKKETKWVLSDPFFRFYYAYIANNQDLIALAGKKSFRVIFTEEAEAAFLSRIYEMIASELVVSLALNDELPFVPKSFQKWRGKEKKKDGETVEREIDGVFYDEKNVLFIECKYRNKLVGTKVLDGLKDKANFVNYGNRKPYYLLMSLKGFTSNLIESKDGSVYLVKEDRLLN